MKNKKLFAILTLVCFMMTLMPVAAFADENDAAASGAKVSIANSAIYQTESKTSVSNVVGTETGVEFTIDRVPAGETTQADADKVPVYVWAVAEGTTSPAEIAAEGTEAGLYYVYQVTGAKTTIVFPEAGKYTVKAGIAKKGVAAVASLNDIAEFTNGSYKISVSGKAAADPEYFWATGDKAVQGMNSVKENPVSEITIDKANGVMSDKYTVTFNKNVEKTEFVLDKNEEKIPVVDKEGKPVTDEQGDIVYKTKKVNVKGDALADKTVVVESTSPAVTVKATTDKTDRKGQIKFTVAGTIEGTYYVELTVEGVTWYVEVTVGNTGATYIETVEQPKAPQALYSDLYKSNRARGTKVRFSITDINGNNVENPAKGAPVGMTDTLANVDGKYIVLTESPEASKLDSEDLGLAYDGVTRQWYLTGVSALDAEGTYAVKVILNNGATATATWEVKKFATPVQLRIDTAVDTVALGATIAAELTYVDANGVEKLAKDATLAATGYAVAKAEAWNVTAKSDEKYVGEKINVMAVSERYNLTASKDYTVVGEAVAIAFADKTADVNVNNRLTWNLVDENGNKIAIADDAGKAAKITGIKYIILDKPEDAKVTVTDASNWNDVANKGIGKVSLTSNKVGNVAVQTVVTAEFSAKGTDMVQTKYYTGTQIFAVGTKGVGDVVVMSIGSNEIVINDKTGTIDAAPLVQNDRTFVPFRALGEAFGATVDFVNETQTVTASLNGVEVVMTIGSATYTVNGVEKTMDVAPFIASDRTYVPVRFAAEAFGIKVIPTYNPDGTTADILFNL